MRVAIIGSGPSGFYAAESLLKRTDTVVHVDMFDRLPTPYGLVRGGVAPDHQNIKAVTRVYEKTAARPTFRFFGNVRFGTDLAVGDLRQHYHQIIYATGNEADRRLGIPGEGIPGCTPASVFIGWYNGHPDYRHAQIDLSVSRVAVIGNGNVAIDAARILLRTPTELENTDIAEHALKALRNSQVSEVFMLGRRGPEQASFTSPELRELGEMQDAEPFVARSELAGLVVPIAERTPLQDKNLKTLEFFAAQQPGKKAKKLHMRFLVSPIEITANSEGRVGGLLLEKNRLEVHSDGTISARGTGVIETLDVGMVLPAIGFSAERIAGVPYDEKAHVISNDDGRVIDPVSRAVIPNEYVVGWARTGPQGLIGSHKAASAHVVANMVNDEAGIEVRELPDRDAITLLLRERGVQIVSFNDWKQLDDVEVARGELRDAPRDKIVDVEAMLAILGQN